MSLVTRQYGPDAKGSKLTNLDMDNNLYYLQSIGVSGLTFSSSTLSLINPTGGTISSVDINVDNRWYIPSGTTVEIESYSQSFIYGDLYVLGELILNDNSQLIILNGNLILSGGTISISGSGQTVLVDLPTFNDLITSGTYSGGTLTLSTSNGSDVTVNGFFTPTNGFTTGVTYNSSTNTITLTDNTNNSLNAYIDGFSGLSVNGILSATTYQNLPDNVTGNYLPLSGGTVTGSTSFTNGLTANTISATTYDNLPQDIFVTGGTYTNGEILFKNNAGSNFTVTGLPIGGAGGEVYYLNLSQTQTPYQEFSPIGTNLTEQTTGVTINSGVTSTIASFLTPTGYPNTIKIPAGVWSFYLHYYKDVVNASFDVFCEVYVYTTGGTETLVLTTAPAEVLTDSPTTSMELTDGYYSGSTIDITDRILVKVRTTNTGSQTNTITFFTEGQQNYSYGITPFSNFNALTCETLSGCTTIVNLENNKVNKGGDTMTGTLNVPTISATTYDNLPGSTSTNCITGLYVSNIHSCSPLYINPFDEGDVLIGSTSLFVDSSTYHVGIGIYPPQARLHVNNTSPSNSLLVDDSTNPDTTPFVIDVSGNTGIGTLTPSEKLEVSGNTRIYGTLSANTVVISGVTVNPKQTIALFFGHDSLSPGDTQTYYIGNAINLTAPISGSDGRRVIIPKTGNIVRVDICQTVGGTVATGSTEYSTFTINNVTQSTQSTITTTYLYNTSNGNIAYDLGTPLSVNVGDKIEIRWTTPAWGTNPTTVRQQMNVYLEY